jgi:hypothetical protein
MSAWGTVGVGVLTSVWGGVMILRSLVMAVENVAAAPRAYVRATERGLRRVVPL